jgi:potassium efflux system protein
MPCSSFGWIRLTLAMTALLCACAFGATPPAPASAGAGPAQSAPTIEPIEPAAIVLRADIDERFAREITARAREPDPAAALVAPLDAIDAGVRKLADSYDNRQLRSLPVLRLESLARYWKFYDDRLAEWRRELQRAGVRYSDAAADIARRRAVWEATRAEAAAGGIAPALSQRVNAILGELAQAEQALSEPLARQLKLARRGSAVRDAVEAGAKPVNAALSNLDRGLFEVDAPSLAAAWRDRSTGEQALSALTLGYELETRFLAEYDATYAWRLRVLALVAVVLLALLVWASRRYRKLAATDPDAQASAPILQRPLASWLVIVLLSVLYLQPHAPMIKHEAVLLLVLIPVLRLLPPRLYAVLGRWPYFVAALYVFYQLGYLLVGVPLMERLHLLATGVLALAAALWLLTLLRRKRETGASTNRSPVLRVGGSLSTIALIAGMIANAVGNVSLAESLTGGVVDSAYFGLAIYASTAVLRAVLVLLLAHRAVKVHVVAGQGRTLLQSLFRLLNLAALVVWIIATLIAFRVYRPAAEVLGDVLTYPIDFGRLTITPGGVLLFAISVVVSFGLARTIQVLLRDEVLPRMALPRGVGNTIATLSYYAIIMAGLMFALVAAGFEVGQLAIVVGALGVGIGFGLQNVVNNFVSGLILMFERPIQPGDVIEVSGTAGTVREIGMRATRLRTFEGADIVVPNGTLLSEKLTNWTLSDMSRRFDVSVGVAYGTDVTKVLSLLRDAAKDMPKIAASPEPMVIFGGFGESSLDFTVRAWTDDFDNWVATRSALTVRIHEALRVAGIEIPFPQRDLHLRSISPEARAGLGGAEPPTSD